MSRPQLDTKKPTMFADFIYNVFTLFHWRRNKNLLLTFLEK